MPYKNIVDCFVKSVRNEGVRALWVGLPTYYMRIAPHSIIVLLMQDYLHDLCKKANI